MTRLYQFCKTDVTLQAALDACKDYLKAAMGLLYSPERCETVKLDSSGRLVDAYNRLKFDSLGVFEARFFNADCELRWLNESGGNGAAALISESDLTPEGFDKDSHNVLEVINQEYLLWGEPILSQSKLQGWQRLGEARIGKLDIPLDSPLKPKDRVFLQSKEYIAEIDNFGNCAVIDERLIKLEVK